MTDAKYVLCKWKERLWPAKVLAGTEKSAKNKRKKNIFLNVQILSLDKKIKVMNKRAKILEKSHIESIASSLASESAVLAAPLEELAYRRALRVALDVLNERSYLQEESTSREERATVSPSEKPAEPAPSPCGPSPTPSLLEDALGCRRAQRRERLHQRLSGPPPLEKDPTCQVDHKDGLGRGGCPPAPALSSADGGPRRSRENWTTPSKRGRSPAQEASFSQNRLLVSEESKALCSPPRAGEEGTLGSPATLLAPGPVAYPHARSPDARSPDGSTVRLGPAEDSGNDHLLDKARQSSEESVELNSVRSILEEDEEDEEPPRILLYHEPRSFEVGMLVWLKYQKYPFWPAVVKSVRRRDKKASVLFIEGNMNPKGRGITVSLRRLKHFDCKEKQTFLDEAKEDFGQAIGWCVSLITDYRVRLGCGSFTGSFLEYYAADISYPVRKSIQQDVQGTRFPQLSREDLEEPMVGGPKGRRQACRKVLPDRSRAARDRANQRLVEYIVKARGAEGHLRDILKNRRPSRWLKTFLSSGQHVTCVETYLEDDEQLDLVVKYLQGLCQEAGNRALAHTGADRIRFVLDVLLPERTLLTYLGTSLEAEIWQAVLVGLGRPLVL
ncbi:PWWP domain-containing DNA repair factor 3A isoform X3 [Phacochoerus africanus]|uniref:PWWP domain-containing DNA repair factor 3A isoform X3 n=1 Tax=Phacochoerus africanus TaxID=41426 RepID=UPI001FD8E54F|nr:PWWP domain-containing DNA repair factor 3A isoform X3 [Phacochoerus africanus]